MWTWRWSARPKHVVHFKILHLGTVAISNVQFVVLTVVYISLNILLPTSFFSRHFNNTYLTYSYTKTWMTASFIQSSCSSSWASLFLSFFHHKSHMTRTGGETRSFVFGGRRLMPDVHLSSIKKFRTSRRTQFAMIINTNLIMKVR